MFQLKSFQTFLNTTRPPVPSTHVQGARTVAAALPLAPRLRAANLSATGLGDDAAAALAAALPLCGALEVLALRRGVIADGGALALAAALEGGACPRLRRLALAGNRFPLEPATLARLRALGARRGGRVRVELLGPLDRQLSVAPAAPSAHQQLCSPAALNRLLSSQPLTATAAVQQGSSAKHAAALRAAGSSSAGAAADGGTTTSLTRSSSGVSSNEGSGSRDDDQLCGVCFDRPNGLRVRACGHPLCVPCYRRIIAGGGSGGGGGSAASPAAPCCPFCRGRIDGFAYSEAIQAALLARLGGPDAEGDEESGGDDDDERGGDDLPRSSSIIIA